MARSRTAVRGEAEHELARQLDSLRRGKVVCNYDGRRPYLDVRARRETRERAQDPSLNVVEVADSLAEIRVVHALELTARAVGRLAHSRLGVEPLADDVPLCLLPERLVLENHQVAFEHPHVVAASALAQDGYERFEVALRLHDRAL